MKKKSMQRRPRELTTRTKEEAIGEWKPKTTLGANVLEGKIISIEEIFEKGSKIREAEIIDYLFPNLKTEIIYVGGSTGKGGGIKRTIIRRTTRMHKSGRRFRISVMVAVGNGNGYVGLGIAKGPAGKQKEVIDKATRIAKLNLIPIRKGCGSWKCNCKSDHSIPFETEGKCGSVSIELKPAPKGIGLTVSGETKKFLRLAGIKDIWCKTRGDSRTRINQLRAVFDALKKMNRFKIQEKYEKDIGLVIGRSE